MSLAALFWISGLLLVYVYVGYPALCRFRAWLQPRPWKPQADFRPFVSVLVAAYNEENAIRQRILNIAAQATDFGFEVLVGSDGSTDATLSLALRAAAEARDFGIEVRAFEYPRGGKISALSLLLLEARGDVVVFTDANSEFAHGALQAAVSGLADPSVGCSSGILRINSGHEQTAGGEKSYWNFENRLKLWESRFGSCAGADGALYAVRRSDLPTFITNRLLADDFYISLSVCRNGRRCIIVPEAIVLEASDTTATKELRRKARILAGALSALLQYPGLLLPGSGMSLTLWSHKVLRWFAFIPICGMMIGAAGLPHPEAYVFYAAVAAAGAAVAMGALFPASLRVTAVKLPYYFALMNFGQVLGLMEWATKRNQPTWENLRTVAVQPGVAQQKEAA
jgi:poly-beta-1,6-N-acetyl-D-glucosamine synthase